MTTPNPTQATPWTTRLMALSAPGGLALTLAYPSATRQFTWPWVVVLSLVWLIPLSASLIAFVKCPVWRRPNSLLTAGLGVLVLGTLVAATASPFARLSILRIWPTLTGVAVFLWLHDWLNQSAASATSRVTALATGIAWAGAIIAAISLVGWRWEWIGQAGIVRNDVPFGHSTYTAGALVLLLPWLVRQSLNCAGVRQLGWGTLSLAGFAALLATSSRGGVIAIGAVGATGAGLGVIFAAWTKRTKAVIVGLTAVILVVAVFTNPRLRELVQGGGWGHSAQESNAQRNAMMEAGWLMGLDRPWTGWGPGTVPLVYPKERANLNGGVDNVLQLHNTPIQLWAALGVGGVLAMVLLLIAVVRRFFQLARPIPGQTTRLAAAASVFGYGLFALTDHQLDLPAMNAFLLLSLALLFQGEPASKPVSLSGHSRTYIFVGAVTVLLLPLVLNIHDLCARYAYERSLSFFEAGQPVEGQAELKEAAQQAHYDPYYSQQMAGRLLEERFQTSDPAKQRELAAAASSQLNRSLTTGCLQEFAHFNLAWLALDEAKPQLAVQHFLAAVREAPHRTGIYFGLGVALRNAGNEPAAIRAFALEWIDDPITYTAPVWEWPDFAPLRPKVEREADALLAALAPQSPTAAYVRQLWAWWKDGTALPRDGFDQESNAFADALDALSTNRPHPVSAANYRWGRLLNEWKKAQPAADFSPAGSDPAFVAALDRREKRHPFPDWHGFFTAGLENESALLVSSRSRRIGYGVLALHPDAPILTDLYVRQQNRFVSEFASSLFPTKGWLVARTLLDRLPPIPANNP